MHGSIRYMTDLRARRIQRALALVFLILAVRFFEMQVIRGSVYRERSDRNSVRQIPVTAARGVIMDREGRILVDNRPSYSLVVIPYEFFKNPADTWIACGILGMDEQTIRNHVEERKGGPFSPVRLIRDMDFAMLTRIQESRSDLPGVYFQAEPVRTYPDSVKAGHVLGYVGEAGEKEISRRAGIMRGSMVGISGVEKQYDALLRGKTGYRYVEVDVRGREVGNFHGERDLAPVPGETLRLTLDRDLQWAAEQSMQGRAGAAIVMDVHSGEVLAMTSHPGYGLIDFSAGMDPGTWKTLVQDPGKPLLHRAVQAQLPPGSVFKLVLASVLAGNPDLVNQTVVCNGTFRLGRRVFRCWKEEGHGTVNLIDAIEGSCNVYFYQTGLEAGLKAWSDAGRRFGFGFRTGIDLPGEAEGLLPDRKYLDEKYGSRGWTQGMIANLSVGQGDLLVTPLQMVRFTAELATGGKMVTPRLLHSVRKAGESQWEHAKPADMRWVRLDPGVKKILDEGMFRVVHGAGGTGRAAWTPNLRVCGKTGTAQNPRGEPHAWFIGFAPRENPEIAVAVVVEHGGSGGSAAAPVAGRLFRTYSEKRAIR